MRGSVSPGARGRPTNPARAGRAGAWAGRQANWERGYLDYLSSRARRPFEWGSHDCCRFACAGLAAQGLADPMRLPGATVRPYKTARGAAGAIRRICAAEGLEPSLDNAATVLAARAGLAETAPAFAGRGDPVLAVLEVPGGTAEPALGLVGMEGTHALFAGAHGLERLPLRKCRRAWRVP